MSIQELETLIKTAFTGSWVEAQDLTGEGSHFQALVVSEQFVGLSMVKQHQLVYGSVNDYIADGRIHALALKTYTPEQWQKTLVQVG